MLKIGILGASWIAHKAIIEPAQSIREANISALGCRNETRGKAYAAEHNIPLLFQDYDELINSPEVDIVYVGLPPATHAYWSIQALNAGKHVICEKPFAMNTQEAKQMLKVAAISKGRLMEAFHTAYHPSFVTCLDWVKNGKIGKVLSMKSHFAVPLEDDGKRNQFRPEQGGGSVMDMGCYPLQWVDAFADGDIASISAEAVMTDSGVDGSMKATLTFDKGTEAEISCSMIGPGEFSAGLTIFGSKGKIEFDNPLVPQDGGTLVLTYNNGDSVMHNVSHASTYHYQLKATLNAFKTGGELVTEGPPVIRQQKLIDDVYAAAGLSHLRNTS